MDFNMLRGVLGIFVILGVAYLASSHRKSINWRTVGGAFAIQITLAALVLYSDTGRIALEGISAAVGSVIDYSAAGIAFLFGGLGTDAMFANGVGFVFAIRVLPVIVFFSSLIAVLYYLGIMDKIVTFLGGALAKFLKTSDPESLSATANIFVGQTEAPLVVRPFLPTMTRSELFAVMTGGLASVAGAVLVGYAGMGIELKYLIAASFMAAPGGLLMAKFIMPEVDEPKNDISELEEPEEDKKPVNVIDAAAEGASKGMMLALNVGAMLMAFVALIALLNGLIGWVGGFFGADYLTLEMILGYVLQPVAWILGVPWEEAFRAGSFLGQKVVVNEFVAYVDFIKYKDELSAGTQAIITFALCGFANLSSIAILLGGLGTLAPNRRHDIAQMGMKAVFAATLANLMSAAIAGVFISLAS
ncbi:NupC/NupG family nucleoside CNT transporter [Thalassotalea sp. HSM 43]|uniref:NupC/NupG family nucleoside CNT transporter n=1 Tax=Thalassotalea sp. HSM 43 TaxID=2552945 RepID=UPI0010800BC2|nr:NupC/NupG family nucleoside CNT transporter [Thalassotalea sp. HSM 43]QBY05921.1 NupC/NupG family nucleoside CNT transporter [Thalassotalea sp. HSM 43]